MAGAFLFLPSEHGATCAQVVLVRVITLGFGLAVHNSLPADRPPAVGRRGRGTVAKNEKQAPKKPNASREGPCRSPGASHCSGKSETQSRDISRKFTPRPRRAFSGECASFPGSDRPVCGRQAAWQRAVESRLHKAVTVVRFSRIPPVIHTSSPQRNPTRQKENSHSLRRLFSSCLFHRRDSEFQRENPDPVLSPNFLTDLCWTSKFAQLCAGSLNGSCAQTNSARGGRKNNNRGGSQSGPRHSPLSICAAAPRLPSPPAAPSSFPSPHIRRGPLIGWPHVAAPTRMGGSWKRERVCVSVYLCIRVCVCVCISQSSRPVLPGLHSSNASCFLLFFCGAKLPNSL